MDREQRPTPRRRAATLIGLVLVTTLCGGLGNTPTGLPTSVIRLIPSFDPSWGLTQIELVSGDHDSLVPVREGQVRSGEAITITLSDPVEEAPMLITVWGLQAGARVAHGETQAIPRLHETVDAYVALSRLPCGVWCTEGTTGCVGDAVRVCEQRDADRCMEWGSPIACPADAPQCSFGRCAATCENECVEGATRCAGAQSTQRCGQTDHDECTDWGPEEPCPAGQVCNEGRCAIAGSCRDDCSLGQSRCLDKGVTQCGEFDGDDCQDWGPVVPCPSGVCENGQCAGTVGAGGSGGAAGSAGNAGTAGASGGTAGSAGSAGTPGTIGAQCAKDTDCVTGVCALPTQNPFFNGGASHGYCTASCQNHMKGEVQEDPCPALQTGAKCVILARDDEDAEAWCLEGCTLGPAFMDAEVFDVLDPNKCHGRRDAVCAMSTTSSQPFCWPLCPGDADCADAGRVCDPKWNVCVDPAERSQGLPFGSSCRVDQPCEGICMTVHKSKDHDHSDPLNVAYICTGYCSFGTLNACGFEKDPSRGLCLYGSLEVGIGELGRCMQLCDVSTDCANHEDPYANVHCDLSTVEEFGRGHCTVEYGCSPDGGC